MGLEPTTLYTLGQSALPLSYQDVCVDEGTVRGTGHRWYRAQSGRSGTGHSQGGVVQGTVREEGYRAQVVQGTVREEGYRAQVVQGTVREEGTGHSQGGGVQTYPIKTLQELILESPHCVMLPLPPPP